MYTYQLLIEYDGSKFVGWQIQNNGLSIQEVIQKNLKKILRTKIVIFGSGRTDKGVHAIEQSAHFYSNYLIKDKINFIKSINFFLSKYNVSILDLKKQKKTFHARFSAKKRTYKYFIVNRQAQLSLEKNRAWNIRKKLDLKLMKKGSALLKGKKNFSTFRSSSCTARSSIKTLNEAKIKKYKDKIEIVFTSQSFLQQQVRSMVGCLKYLGEGKWNIQQFKKALNSKKRSSCAPPAPPEGLYLYKVKY